MNMPATAQPTQSLGSLAVQIPGATAVFRKLKLDFCCGGQQSLEKACADKQLDLSTVLGEIRALQHQAPMPTAPSAGELIDHILQRYHDVHRQQLDDRLSL
mgnify:FL=1